MPIIGRRKGSINYDYAGIKPPKWLRIGLKRKKTGAVHQCTRPRQGTKDYSGVMQPLGLNVVTCNMLIKYQAIMHIYIKHNYLHTRKSILAKNNAQKCTITGLFLYQHVAPSDGRIAKTAKHLERAIAVHLANVVGLDKTT